jgi:hypothetical protein
MTTRTLEALPRLSGGGFGWGCSRPVQSESAPTPASPTRFAFGGGEPRKPSPGSGGRVWVGGVHGPFSQKAPPPRPSPVRFASGGGGSVKPSGQERGCLQVAMHWRPDSWRMSGDATASSAVQAAQSGHAPPGRLREESVEVIDDEIGNAMFERARGLLARAPDLTLYERFLFLVEQGETVGEGLLV